MIDDCWWFGTVERKEAFSEDFPRSHYQCFKVKWDNGDDELMSPWDLVPIPPGISSPKNTRNVPAKRAEVEQLASYKPSERDWPDESDETERVQRIVESIESLASVDGMELFLHPVSLVMYPDYSARIAYPVDLGTVKERVISGFYRFSDFSLFLCLGGGGLFSTLYASTKRHILLRLHCHCP